MTSAPALLGIGTAQPESVWSQDDSVRFALARAGNSADGSHADRRLLQALYRRSGVRTRCLSVGESFYPVDRSPTTRERMVAYTELATPLAAQAATRSLASAHLAAGDIRHLVSVSCTGFSAPGLDLGLLRALELPRDVGRTHVGFMGCHGLLNGLTVARALAEEAPVLLCAAELCSLHFSYGAPKQRAVAHSLFADGAAALVLGPSTDRTWRVVSTASCLLHDDPEAMTWDIGDHGFEMTLSSLVPALIGGTLRPWLDHWLQGHGLAIPDIGSWAIHPGGPRVLDAATSVLELPDDACALSREVLAECGNMSSPTVGFLLERLVRSGARTPCVALAFGPGLVAEAALLDTA